MDRDGLTTGALVAKLAACSTRLWGIKAAFLDEKSGCVCTAEMSACLKNIRLSLEECRIGLESQLEGHSCG